MILSLQERLKIIIGTKKSNCVGTALFLSGLRKDDYYGSTNEVRDEILRKLNETNNPRERDVVAWYGTNNPKGERLFDKLIIHMAIVIRSEPLLLAHRREVNGLVETNIPFEKVNKEYFATAPGHERGRVEFYQVPIL